MVRFQKLLLYLFLIISGFVTLMPFVWMLSASFMPDGHASVYPPRFWPDQFTLIQYIRLFTRLNVGRYFFNSLFLAIAITFISLFLNSMAGYAFAKYRFKGKNFLFNLLLSSMIIPAQITMLPLFLMLKTMGLINTYFAIIIPGLANIFGFSLFANMRCLYPIV